MAEWNADFYGAGDATVQLLHPDQVHEDVWRDLRAIDMQWLKSLLPREQWDRADNLTHMHERDGLETYVQARTDANARVGTESLNDNQTYIDPLTAVIWHGRSPVGMVNLADNISSRSGSRAELTIKGLFPKWRYVNLRDFAIHPDYTLPDAESDGARRMSGLVIGALFHGLSTRSQRQNLTLYTKELPEGGGVDPADAGMAALAAILRMWSDPGLQEKRGVPGYPSLVYQRRITKPVGDTEDRIVALPGAREAVDSMTVLVPKS